MIHKKISIIFPYLPKYDVDFILELKNRNPMLNIDIYADMSSNDLYRDDQNIANLNIFDTRIYKLGPFWFMTGLFKLLKSKKDNIIVFNANPRDLSQLILMVIFKIMNRNIIAWGMFHRIGGSKWHSSIYYRLVGIICTRVFVYGEFGKLNLLSLGTNKNKIFKIGNAIKFPDNHLSSKMLNSKKNQILDKYKYLKDKFLLLQVVRLTAIKKPFLLIDLVEELIKITDNFHLILIGGGELEGELIKLIKQKSLDEHISILGPIYNDDDLSGWFGISDIFIMPTCIGLSAHQSMYFGLPVITDDSKINQASESEILIDNFNCLRYKEGDIKDFASKVLFLKENSSFLKKIAKNTTKNIDEFTIQKKVDNFILGLSNLK